MKQLTITDGRFELRPPANAWGAGNPPVTACRRSQWQTGDGHVTDNRITFLMTMANILTISRFLLIPVFLAFIFLRQFTSALIVFVFASLTDFLDGVIARRFGQITELGKVLDPLVDRLLIASALISLTILERIPLWLLLAVGIRDLAMMLGAVLLRVLKAPAVEITLLGKVSSTLLLFAIALNILRPDLSHPLLYTSLVFSIVSGLDYVYRGTLRVTGRAEK